MGVLLAWNAVTIAAELGQPFAQHVLATAYSTGLYGGYLVPMNAARALYLEEMAAMSGHVLANMGMGYRFLHGIVVAESCERALPHYEFAANHVLRQLESRGGVGVYVETSRLSELDVAPSASRMNVDTEVVQACNKFYHVVVKIVRVVSHGIEIAFIRSVRCCCLAAVLCCRWLTIIRASHKTETPAQQ